MVTCGESCNSSNRSSRTASSGAHYALCALGVGLIALGIVMIVWTVIPLDGEDSSSSSGSSANSNNNTAVPGSNDEEEEESDRTKSSSVALVLVGVGVAILFLSICLGVRSKRRESQRRSQRAAGAPFMDHVAADQEEEAVDPNTYNVPSYDEVVGSEDYPVRHSNLRQSTSQLPSYEDILAAVENEGREPANSSAENGAPGEAAAAAATEPDAAGLSTRPSLPARSASRASRLLRPLRVRRIKSDKLHLKDFRLQIRSPTQNPVTIEPITPPPGYENKMPDLQ